MEARRFGMKLTAQLFQCSDRLQCFHQDYLLITGFFDLIMELMFLYSLYRTNVPVSSYFSTSLNIQIRLKQLFKQHETRPFLLPILMYFVWCDMPQHPNQPACSMLSFILHHLKVPHSVHGGYYRELVTAADGQRGQICNEII